MTTRIAYLLLAAAVALPLHAAKRALLIGIGTYRDSQLPLLEGPPFDIASMRELLAARGFADMHALVGPQATRAAILEELKQLQARVKPGDYVVFYYSGHGTSSGDANGRAWGIDVDTGALLPYDVRTGQPGQVNAQLIIGKRDLRPVFAEIDKVATLFAILDTCYSADSAKSSARPVKSRYIPPASLVSATRSAGGGANDLDAATDAAIGNREAAKFPYEHAITLSAAGKFEEAGDISRDDIRQDPSISFDKNPHGVFTEALLRGMKGEADKDGNGRISHDELYSYLQERAVRWKHRPVLQAAPGADQLLASVAFDSVGDMTLRPPQPASRKLLVRTEGVGAGLAARLSNLPGLAPAAAGGPYDLLVRRGSSGFELYDSSQLAVSYDALSEKDLLTRVAAQPRIRELLDLSYSQQFNVALRMQPGDQSVLFDGDDLQFSARTDRKAWLLLLNVEVSGAVTVVYPYNQAPPAFEPGQEYLVTGSSKVAGPLFGLEYMKLIAFTSKPAGYDEWNASEKDGPITVAPGTLEFERLMRMLQSTREGRAETKLRLTTSPRPAKN
jgi:hypothetical protein